MASIFERGMLVLPLRVLGEDSASSSNPTDAVISVGISLVLGIACRHALRGCRILSPCFFSALAFGALGANIDPDLLLAVFLPALFFESSFSMEVHQIKRCMMQMFILAGPGVLISTFCLGAVLKVLLCCSSNCL